jgi:tetratricopeptide (TPR) repeat protein
MGQRLEVKGVSNVQTETERWLAEGSALVAHQDYALALIPLNRVVTRAKVGAESSKAWCLNSRALVALGHLEQALAAGDHAVHDNPGDLQALAQRAYVYFLLERYAEAQADYERLVEATPDDLDLWIKLGDARLSGGDATRALDAYQRALDLDATAGAAWYSKGAALERLQQRDEALIAYQHAMRLTPGNALLDAMARNRAAIMFLRAHRLAEAMTLAEQVQQSDTAPVHEQAIAWGIGGHVLYEQGRYLDALTHYSQALTLQPELADFWHGKGLALHKLERIDAALAAYDHALQLDSTNHKAQQDRLYALAHQLLTQTPPVSPTAPAFAAITSRKIWMAEAKYFAARRRFPELEAAVDQLLRLNPNDTAGRLFKVFIQILQRHYRAAWNTLRHIWKTPGRV